MTPYKHYFVEQSQPAKSCDKRFSISISRRCGWTQRIHAAMLLILVCKAASAIFDVAAVSSTVPIERAAMFKYLLTTAEEDVLAVSNTPDTDELLTFRVSGSEQPSTFKQQFLAFNWRERGCGNGTRAAVEVECNGGCDEAAAVVTGGLSPVDVLVTGVKSPHYRNITATASARSGEILKRYELPIVQT